jgi:uncharacterized membrane protein YfcA
MTIFAAVGLGILIGVSLGALGGGGSILTVPALVYALGESAHAATTESLVIVGITSVVAAAGHARVRHVRWGSGMIFGLVGVASSYAGTALNRHVNPNALLLAFAVLLVAAAIGMLRGARAQARARAAGRNVALKIIIAGLAVGFLTGFFGVGGGFVIVPALVMVLGYDMPIAVGTSLLIIAINSAASLAARAGSEAFHWGVIVPFTVAAIAGSLGGKRVADQVPSTTLAKAFAALLVTVAGYVAIRSGIALTSPPN